MSHCHIPAHGDEGVTHKAAGALGAAVYDSSAETLLRKPVSMFPSRCKGPSGFKAYQVVALLILSIAAALPAFAQAQSQPNAGPGVASAHAAAGSANKRTFEVASIRPGP